MAKAGWLTANMEYELYNASLSAEEKKEYTVFKVLDEIDMALAKLKEVGAEHGYQVENVALSGHSAGGHLTMQYGYTYKTRENANPQVNVAFIAPRVGPSDFYSDRVGAGVKDTPDDRLKLITYLVSAMSGVEIAPKDLKEGREETVAALRSISPAAFIAEGAVPTIAAYGAFDVLVPEGTNGRAVSEEFQKLGAKELADVSTEDTTTPVFDYLVFPKSDHMLGNDPDYTQKWYELFDAYARRYLSVPEEK